MVDDINGGVFDDKVLAELFAKAHALRSDPQTYPRLRQKAALLNELAALCQQSLQFVAETFDESELPNLQTAIELLRTLAGEVRDDQYKLIVQLQSKTNAALPK
jgi:hypothetical protein